MVGGADTLRDWIDAEPEAALGPDRSGLPFLLKLLAAAAPLSLQRTPPEQAREGFAREEAAGSRWTTRRATTRTRSPSPSSSSPS